jgi:hypothetical protein
LTPRGGSLRFGDNPEVGEEFPFFPASFVFTPPARQKAGVLFEGTGTDDIVLRNHAGSLCHSSTAQTDLDIRNQSFSNEIKSRTHKYTVCQLSPT